MFLLLFGAASAALLCGRSAGWRACVELEQFGSAVCINSTLSSSFETAALSADREIVAQFAELAPFQTQECMHNWRRAQCAARFLLIGADGICPVTCATLSSCPSAVVAQCTQISDPFISCSDLATQTTRCVLPPDAPAFAPSPPRPAPAPAPRWPQGGGAASIISPLLSLVGVAVLGQLV